MSRWPPVKQAHEHALEHLILAGDHPPDLEQRLLEALLHLRRGREDRTLLDTFPPCCSRRPVRPLDQSLNGLRPTTALRMARRERRREGLLWTQPVTRRGSTDARRIGGDGSERRGRGRHTTPPVRKRRGPILAKPAERNAGIHADVPHTGSGIRIGCMVGGHAFRGATSACRPATPAREVARALRARPRPALRVGRVRRCASCRPIGCCMRRGRAGVLPGWCVWPAGGDGASVFVGEGGLVSGAGGVDVVVVDVFVVVGAEQDHLVGERQPAVGDVRGGGVRAARGGRCSRGTGSAWSACSSARSCA